MPSVLEKIKKENDIKKIPKEDYERLAEDIRHFLVRHISHTGGHLASNLGVVELTMALHLNMDFPKDQLIWDVGHQAYTHKILTGRKEEFKSLRQYGGISGFPRGVESPCDAFDTGHSSTSISAALGMAAARDLKGENHKIAAVIGDGALSGGMAYEALNNAARLKSNLIIILNDNNMSISENVGGMANYLGKIRTNSKYQDLKEDVELALRKLSRLGEAIAEKIRRSKDSIKRLMIPGMLFEDMGLTYIGPIDGHNLEQLNMAIGTASRVKEAVIVHVVTRKGKGYRLAEKNPQAFHGVEPFHARNGQARTKAEGSSYTAVFGEALVRLAAENRKVVAITAAMPSGTGLIPFRDTFPSRFFDVGIAEEHGVTFGAGLAKAGLIPVFAVYSTFLQRAYDQILHDVCINGLPFVFIVDRAGLVGNDGATHQGIFDISYLSHIPGITIMAPKNRWELEEMLPFAIGLLKPVAIRYPRGTAYEGLSEFKEPIAEGKLEILYEERDILLLALGSMVRTAEEVRNRLKEKGYLVSLVNMRFAQPLDIQAIERLCGSHSIVVTLEENVRTGGFGQQVIAGLSDDIRGSIRWLPISLPDQFIEHGDVDKLKEIWNISPESILNIIEREAAERDSKL